MIWAAIFGHEQSDAVLLERDFESKKHGYSSRSYIKVLENIPSCWEPGRIYMQDNAKIHKSHATMKWFRDNGIDLLEFPPYSPDLNPIEQLWFHLKELVNILDPELRDFKAGEEELRERLTSAVQRAWLCISPERIRALVESMDTRINAVIEAEGWYTRF